MSAKGLTYILRPFFIMFNQRGLIDFKRCPEQTLIQYAIFQFTFMAAPWIGSVT